MPKTYTVTTPVKIRGRWQHAGAQVVLTDAEREQYAAAFADDTPAYLPGQEPQPSTPVAPLMKAQAEAGDLAAQKQIAQAGTVRALEGRGDVDDSDPRSAVYQDRAMRPGPAYLAGQRPQAPTPAAPPAQNPTDPAPQEPTPESAIESATGGAQMEHTGGGWYEIRTASGTERVRGKDAAEARFAELT